MFAEIAHVFNFAYYNVFISIEAVLETPTTFCQGMNVKICVWLILMPLKKCATSILMLALVVVRLQDGDTTRRLVNVSSFNTEDVREIKKDS